LALFSTLIQFSIFHVFAEKATVKQKHRERQEEEDKLSCPNTPLHVSANLLLAGLFVGRRAVKLKLADTNSSLPSVSPLNTKVFNAI
jgi:hypothetical protein